MGLRDAMDKKPMTTVAVVCGIIVLCLCWIVYNFLPDHPAVLDKAFYSDDDGKTWFVDSKALVPPFDHDGKQAVRVMMFTCGDTKKQFVGYLERYKPEMKQRLDASAAAVAAGKLPTVSASEIATSFSATEFKKPGDANWTSGSNLKAKQKLFNGLCPSSNDVDTVVP